MRQVPEDHLPRGHGGRNKYSAGSSSAGDGDDWSAGQKARQPEVDQRWAMMLFG